MQKKTKVDSEKKSRLDSVWPRIFQLEEHTKKSVKYAPNKANIEREVAERWQRRVGNHQNAHHRNQENPFFLL